jgi:hypothetical protein
MNINVELVSINSLYYNELVKEMNTSHVRNAGNQSRLSNFPLLPLPVMEKFRPQVRLLQAQDLPERERRVKQSKTGCFTSIF